MGKNSEFTKTARSADTRGKIVVSLMLPFENMADITKKELHDHFNSFCVEAFQRLAGDEQTDGSHLEV